MIEQARAMALRYTATLPNFICTETMRRTKRAKNSQSWNTLDILVLDVAFTEKGENYKLLTIDGKPARKTLKQVGGIRSTGEFGSSLQQLFRPETEARFRWERADHVGDVTADVFSYQVEQAHSKAAINIGGFLKHYRMVMGYHGLVYVDRESYRVLRMTDEADGIPQDWPIVATSADLKYGAAEIGGEKFVLPLRVERRIVERGGAQRLNFIEFREYRKFSAEATVTFEKQ